MAQIIPSRRSFLTGLAAALAAPAVVQASSLMPVRTPIVMRPDLVRTFVVTGVVGRSFKIALYETPHPDLLTWICGPSSEASLTLIGGGLGGLQIGDRVSFDPQVLFGDAAAPQ